jgi:hypothetical protein
MPLLDRVCVLITFLGLPVLAMLYVLLVSFTCFGIRWH